MKGTSGFSPAILGLTGEGLNVPDETISQHVNEFFADIGAKLANDIKSKSNSFHTIPLSLGQTHEDDSQNYSWSDFPINWESLLNVLKNRSLKIIDYRKR